MINIYKSIFSSFAIAYTMFSFAMEPKSLTALCLSKIYKKLTYNLSDQNFIDNLDTLTDDVK